MNRSEVLHVELIAQARRLRFADGSPVRAASALAPLGAGWLVAQDDATYAAWLPDRPGGHDAAERWPLLPAVEGLDVFDEADGTKHLKPDLEAACAVPGGLLLLGSGSTPARMRGVLVDAAGATRVGDLAPTCAAVARALGVEPADLNLEGAYVAGDRLRWFQRGLPALGVPSAAVDLPLDHLLAAVRAGRPVDVEVLAVQVLDLGSLRGGALAVTDAVALGDGRMLVAAAAEDAPTTYDDGPVVASALALLDAASGQVLAVAEVPLVGGRVAKVEGLALAPAPAGLLEVMVCVDADDPDQPSALLRLRVSCAPQRAE